MFRTRFEKEIVADTRGAMCGGFFRSYGACSSRAPFTHGLRTFDRLRAGCGLHSAAASRLKSAAEFRQKCYKLVLTRSLLGIAALGIAA